MTADDLGSGATVQSNTYQQGSSVGEVSLLHMVNSVLRHGPFLVLFVCACVASLVFKTLATPRSYTATAMLVPQSRSGSSTVSGLAAQFGFTVPGSDVAQTPAFYADLVQSRPILESVLSSPIEYQTAAGLVRGTVLDAFAIPESTDALRREEGVKALGWMVSATLAPRTGVLWLRVKTSSASLSAQIAARVLDALNRFNTETRQSRAAAERRFIEGRKREVERDLRQAEDRLQEFLQSNRDYRASPELAFQNDRLLREVGFQQQLYSSLAQSYEQARIEEVRDTPVLTVLQRPIVPARPDARGLLKRAIFVLLLSTTLGVAIVLLLDHWAVLRDRDPSAFQEFGRVWRNLVAPARSAWKFVSGGRLT